MKEIIKVNSKVALHWEGGESNDLTGRRVGILRSRGETMLFILPYLSKKPRDNK